SLDRRGYPPSIRELCEALGIASTRGVVRHLEALERKGYITRGPGARAISAGGPRRGESLHLPLVGQVPAGPLNYASEEVREWLPVPRALGGREGCFLLRVKGDSMSGDHISDGDLLVVDPQVPARPGEIVVAIVEGDATVKRFRRVSADEVELVPSNPDYAPIRVRVEEFRIAGRVTGLLRDLA
ncbi:MAG: transcriptional repressor LexA, partial [Candidatus Geothermincolia bacterium]